MGLLCCMDRVGGLGRCGFDGLARHLIEMVRNQKPGMIEIRSGNIGIGNNHRGSERGNSEQPLGDRSSSLSTLPDDQSAGQLLDMSYQDGCKLNESCREYTLSDRAQHRGDRPMAHDSGSSQE